MLTRVDRNLAPQKLLENIALTRRLICMDDSVIQTIPRSCNLEEVKIEFFKPGLIFTDQQKSEELVKRKLVPDPYAQIQANIDDPSFADTHPNGMSWQDQNGQWCFAAFGRWEGERRAIIYRHDYIWFSTWWFGGVPQPYILGRKTRANSLAKSLVEA